MALASEKCTPSTTVQSVVQHSQYEYVTAEGATPLFTHLPFVAASDTSYVFLALSYICITGTPISRAVLMHPRPNLFQTMAQPLRLVLLLVAYDTQKKNVDTMCVVKIRILKSLEWRVEQLLQNDNQSLTAHSVVS